MRKYTESYPLVCVGRILAYPCVVVLRTAAGGVFGVHPGNQSSRLVGRVRRVQKGHPDTCNIQKDFFKYLPQEI